MYLTNNRILAILISFCSVFVSSAQETNEPKQVSTKITSSYIFGGQIYNDNFFYNPGFSFDAAILYPINEQLKVGFGASYLSLQNERFTPVFIDIMSYKKDKKNPPFIDFQFGYSQAWNQIVTTIYGYDFKGGIFVSVGTGKKIEINTTYSLLFHWAYKHQFAKMNYTIYGIKAHTELLNYDMFTMSLSLLYH